MKEADKFNFMERIMLQHSYLPKLISDCVGIVLGIYFLWNNNLAYALISLFGLSIFGNIIAWKQDISKLAETKLGKWMLLQAKPINLIVRSIGAIVLAYGVWLHSLNFILIGIGIIVLARIISKFEFANR
jgi:hypothetical protein